MKIILNDEEMKVLKEANEITMTDYITDLDLDSLICAIRDLIYEYHNLEEEFKDYKEIEEANEYFERSPYGSRGISESDFH